MLNIKLDSAAYNENLICNAKFFRDILNLN